MVLIVVVVFSCFGEFVDGVETAAGHHCGFDESHSGMSWVCGCVCGVWVLGSGV